MASSSTRSCVQCGRAIGWDVNVCPYCGKDYRVQAVAPAAHDTVGTGMKIFLYLLSFFIPIIGFIIGAIYYTKPDPDFKHVGKMCIILGILSILLVVICWAIVAAAVWSFAWV